LECEFVSAIIQGKVLKSFVNKLTNVIICFSSDI
jgi:hypothetical protein